MLKKKKSCSKKHLQKLSLVDVERMSKKEAIQKQKIIEAFSITKEAGPPKTEIREIQKIIARRNIKEIRVAIKSEDHLSTRAMLIRNLGLIAYQRVSNA